MDTQYEFITELPPPTPTERQQGKYVSFFKAARENAGQWGKFPNQGKNGSGRSGVASQIRAGSYAGCKQGEFQTATRQGVLYVRYVGHMNQENPAHD